MGNLNRKVAYSQLANFIIDQLQGLYPSVDHPQTQFLTPPVSPPTNPATSEAECTEIRQDQHFPPPLAKEPDDATNYTLINQSAYTEKTAVSQGKKTITFPTTQLQDSQPTQKAYDPFEIRLEVMKYANPLRAKILSFSTLHHQFETTGKEWSSLRTQSFDRLLSQLYETYPDFQELEQQLYATAQHLEAPDESQQAAEAIAQAMKPYYPTKP
ncbi:MAG: hypothetical protein F6K03_05340 [Kamptonema sp. SIO4C4]|nr:hypothetical protein [Kamptonema sp. SIO4C4]